MMQLIVSFLAFVHKLFNWDTFWGAVEAIAAVLNLLLVIIFFYRDKEESRKREAARIEEDSYIKWYSALVLDRLLKQIDSYFDDIEYIVRGINVSSNGLNLDELTENTGKLKDCLYDNKRVIIPVLALFDRELMNSVLGEIIENHDNILTASEDIQNGRGSKNRIYEMINVTKSSTYKKLYEYDMKHLKTWENDKARDSKENK